ncbi:MAG: adenine-specific methyltransferase EcoRI family protein [Kiritimatiellae bacterium]|nr:adenine-specific methyltransferase EcoRI family protein [Kiritimatiellia bacterium]
MANKNLSEAKRAKQDEFYTQMPDIQAEINAYLDYDADTFRGKTVLLPCDDPEWSNFTLFFAQNFERLGLKKLISTSYAPESKTAKYGVLFEYAALQNGETPKNERCKIFVLDHDVNKNGRIDFDDLEWEYLKGDGDFRSEEVCKLRDEADVIVTNPPFSMFREFLAWIFATKNTEDTKGRAQNKLCESLCSLWLNKKFLIIGNMNAITYKEVFPLIKENKMWLGNGFAHGNAYFRVADGCRTEYADGVYDAATNLVKFRNVAWFTNLDHGRRHQPLQLMTMTQNIKHSKHREVRGVGYRKYDNYDAIEVPFTDAIPGDYEGVMGVPISFLDKYCPEQFEIVGVAKAGAGDPALKTKNYPEQIQVAKDGRETVVTKLNDGPALRITEPPKGELYYKIGAEMFVQAYARILIRRR